MGYVRPMKPLLLALLLSGCRRPLKPGETRCTTTPVGDSYVTKCETGQPLPPDAQP